MSNVSGANQLILDQIQKYVLEKYPDMQNKLDSVKEILQVLQGKVLSKNSELSNNANTDSKSNSLAKSLVRDDLLEVTTPIGVVKNRSERKVAELEHTLVKVIPHNSWHYSSLNNFNNSKLPKSVIKSNITKLRRDNEMQLRDPSGQYRNFTSWNEKVSARIEDKLIKEVYERNLPFGESVKKLIEKKKRLYTVLEESDYIPRKKVNEILYDDLKKEERSQKDKTFSRKGGQRYLATSSENPSSQIPYKYKGCKFKKRGTSPKGI
jgi:hypothetical protein